MAIYWHGNNSNFPVPLRKASFWICPGGEIHLKEGLNQYTIAGDNFKVIIDKATGIVEVMSGTEKR